MAAKTPTQTRWSTNLTFIEPNRVLLRGYPLDELMGRINFGEAIYLIFTGDLPSPSIGRLMEAMLVSFIDHGATPPPTLAARNAATSGASLRGCIAAGILGFGRHYGGDTLACRQHLEAGLVLVRSGRSVAEAAQELVTRLVAAGEVPPPGFGHRFHTRDPRAIRLLQIAHELEVDHEYAQMLRAIELAMAQDPALKDRSLPINVDGAVSAICGDIGMPPEVADAMLLISRAPGLAAHAMEEQRREAPMRAIEPSMYVYDGPSERRLPDRRK